MNKCPYCGCDDMISIFVDTYNCRIKCKSCDAVGPVHFGGADGALDAFTHPAHLMATLHTFDPETEVKIKRETGEYCFYRLEAAGLKYGGSPVGLAAMADLTTALEGKP